MLRDYSLIIQVSIALVAGIATVLTTVAMTTWKVSRYLSAHEAIIIKLLTDHQSSDILEFNKIRKEIDETGDTIRHEFGETAIALRTKIHTIELEMADVKVENLETFIKRSSFYTITSEMGTDIKALVGTVSGLKASVELLIKKSKG